MEPKYGFVVPFYRNEAYLWETLGSIVNQTEENWISVVIDDSGEQNSIENELLRHFDKRFIYLKNQSNIGAVKSWNLGVNYFKDLQHVEIVSIIHADDSINPKYLESVILAHTVFPRAVAVYTDAKTIDSDSKTVFNSRDWLKSILNPTRRNRFQILHGDAGLALLLRANFIFCPALSFKIDEIYGDLFNEDWKMVADLELVTKLLIDGKLIVGISESLYNYRRHSNNLTKTLNSSLERFDEESKLFSDVFRKSVNLGLTRSAFYAKLRFSNRLSLIAEVLNSLLKLDMKRIAYLMKLLSKSISDPL